MAEMLELRVKKCMEKVLERQLEEMSSDCSLQDDLEMTSLNLVMLQVEIEEEFKFIFDPLEDDFGWIFETYGNLCEYVRNKI